MTLSTDEAKQSSQGTSVASAAVDSRDDAGLALSQDSVFGVLANQRRRAVIRLLSENGGKATAGTLAEWIAAEENGTTVQQLSSSERKCVYVSLYQNHLPMMDDAGVIDYDDRKTVESRETVTQLQPYLEEGEEPRTHRVVGGTTILVAVGILLGILQVGLFDVVSLSMWTLLGAVTLLGIAVLDLSREPLAELPGR